jgi:kynurenine 3-monooxygenase
MSEETVTIVGSGLAGAMLACHLGQMGRRVDLYERRPDPRQGDPERGRSINLALSTRGLHALEVVGLAEEARALGVLMRGRMIHHPDSTLTYQPYGNDDTQALHSVPRGGLNRLLVEKAATYPGVRLFFSHKCTGIDLESGEADFATSEGPARVTARHAVGADGAWSQVRAAMQRREGFDYSQEYLGHSYKELTIPPAEGGGFRMEKHALHIWPRGGHMMIALPNSDGSYTCTLFWPHEMFAALKTPEEVREHFLRDYPDAVPHLIGLEEQYAANPVSPLVTIRCRPWHEGKAVLLGDACHAVVPFLGQGMNAAFEDCVVLAECLGRLPWTLAVTEYEALRKPHTDTLARLCIDNFIEMRDKVGSRWFVLWKKLGLWLHKLMPRWYIPLYTMVEFTRIGYADAERRAIWQDRAVAWAGAGLAALAAGLAWWATR